jgi:subtilisin family serine protease
MKSLKKIALVSCASFLLFSCQKETFEPQDLRLDLESAANGALVTGKPEFFPNELLVKFKKGTTAAARGKALGLLNASLKEHIHTAAMKRAGDEQGVLLVAVNANALEAISKAKGFAEVEYAEPNWIYQHQATSNDPYFTNGSLWGMYGAGTSPANQYGSGAATAWAAGKTGLSSVYVGIIDEGYMFNHTDLSANAWLNPFDAVDGKDNDANGYIDDTRGWDFAGNNNTVFDGTIDDHGTHVAGTIGARGANLNGVAGIVWNVKLIGAKFLGTNGGSTANAIKAIDYFIDLKSRHGLNIVATNNSWGGGGYSQGLFDAINRSNSAGILFIAAAGNSSTDNDVTASYPSNYNLPNVIAVASITSSGALSGFSQFGATTVDLGAPGSAIWSTVPTSSKGKVVSGYASYQGTSMATPHVTGAAALYKSLNSSATAAQIKSAILNSATATPSLSGKCVTGGRLNVSGF